jgi:transposase
MKAAVGGRQRPPRDMGKFPKEESDVFFVGMDVHTKQTVYHILDSAGQTLRKGAFATRKEAIIEFCNGLPRRMSSIFLEASTCSAWFARIVESCGLRVVVTDPNRLKAISQSSKKTDKQDAMTLATLGRAGLLTEVHVRTEETDRFRKLLTMRHGLVQARARLITMTRSLFQSEGHRFPHADGDDFGARLADLWTIPKGFEDYADPMVAVLQKLTDEILAIEGEILEKAHESEKDGVMEWLKSIPGVGELVASGFMALMETPGRFQSAAQVGAWLGLVPRVDESAGKRKEGHITKRGHKVTRSLLVQAAHAHINCRDDTALKQWYNRIVARIGKKKAITALARKIGELMWALWRKEEMYQPFPPSVCRSAAAT